MNDQLKNCPFCGSAAVPNSVEPDRVNCSTAGCYQSEHWRPYGMTVSVWNHRPVEDAQAAELTRLREANRWIPVGERLPDDPGTVLIKVKGISRPKIGQLTASKRWHTWGGMYEFEAVTHWRPLPEPPAQDQEG